MSQLKAMRDEVVAFCHAKGWSGPGSPSLTFGDSIALLHTEVSEAMEAFRRWGTDDATLGEAITGTVGLPKPEGVGSEFADVFIRLLDDCDRYGVDLEAEFRRKMDYNHTRSLRHGGKAL